MAKTSARKSSRHGYRRGTAHVAANIAEVNDSAGSITSASTQILTSAKSLSQEGNRLSIEMEKLLAAVCAA